MYWYTQRNVVNIGYIIKPVVIVEGNLNPEGNLWQVVKAHDSSTALQGHKSSGISMSISISLVGGCSKPCSLRGGASLPSPSNLPCLWAEWPSIFLKEAHQHIDTDYDTMIYKKHIFVHSDDQNIFLMYIWSWSIHISGSQLLKHLDFLEMRVIKVSFIRLLRCPLENN